MNPTKQLATNLGLAIAEALLAGLSKANIASTLQYNLRELGYDAFVEPAKTQEDSNG